VPYMAVLIVAAPRKSGVSRGVGGLEGLGVVRPQGLETEMTSRPLKGSLRLLLAVYFIMGLGAAGYSVYTMYHKEVLARTQAGGIFRNEYETWFFGRPMSDTATHPVDQEVLSILKRYN
jgi:hypothetical protein